MKNKIVIMGALVALAMGAQADKPNIIVIMADDMGFQDAGFTGSKDIKTPHLDKLAAEGVVFEQGYANHPFCGPSRAAFITGRYQHRFGFETNPAYDPANTIMGLDPEEIMFPKRLQKAGYTTGIIGKWHLGAAEDFHPNNRGFDYFYGFLGGGHDYFRIDLSAPVKEAYLQGLVRNKRPADFEGYLTTALSRDAVKFVEGNKDHPFFLFLSYNCPHAPQQAPEEDIARYSHIEDKKRRTYCAMVDVMDRGIGEVVQALEKNGIRENTLIFFTSDNGGPQSSPKQPGKGNGSSNAPFRGGKGNLYDGGVHVPFMANWPAKLPKGKRYSYPVIALDIGRTAVELAGADPMAGKPMEGVNLVPFVTGKTQGAPHEALFWRGGSHWSVLASDGTKHMKDKDSKGERLYYLPKDVSESNDLLAKQPERAKALRSAWETWNEGNVQCRLLGYKDYHKKRDAFFEGAVPEASKKEGYQPKARDTFQ
ncbi:sulfatase-like hydrolase/transferase [Pontiellaceae bacterium B12227]|nr:sulfatase-like hydrolase/transferase [Pontiellaceae bacterium B12227]